MKPIFSVFQAMPASPSFSAFPPAPMIALLVGVALLAACTSTSEAAPEAAVGAMENAGPGTAGQAGAEQTKARSEDDAARILARVAADCSAAGVQRGASALRSREALESAARGAGVAGASLDALLAWPVDFAAGESVAMVRAGQLPNPAWTLAVDHDPVLVGDALVLSARIERPPPGRMVVQMVVHPCVFARVSAADYKRIDARWIERR